MDSSFMIVNQNWIFP